jgi:hypothetical protein
MIAERLKNCHSRLLELGITDEDYVFIGSVVLGVLNLREPGDIDVAVTPAAYEKISKNATLKYNIIEKSGTININKDCQILKNRYSNIRLNDSKLLSEPSLIFHWNGLRIVRPELETAKKISRGFDKDKRDVSLLLEYAVRSDVTNWDWSYLKYAKPFTKRETIIAGLRVLRSSPKRFVVLFKKLIIEQLGRPPFWKKKFKDLSVPTIDIGLLVQNHMLGSEFTRYDVLVRKRAVEEVRRLGDVFDAYDSCSRVLEDYDSMQRFRTGRTSRLGFLRLISSVICNGYDKARFPLVLNKHGALFDGSHRFACALAFEEYQVPVFLNRFLRVEPNYGRSWFSERFPEETLKALDAEAQNVIVKSGASFNILIWPPAEIYYQEILDYISRKFTVLRTERNIKLHDFSRFASELYALDGIADWKIARKIHFFKNFENRISLINIVIPEPKYRLKDTTGSFLSSSMALLKEDIRMRIGGKVINYFSDIVCHSGDNPQMNRELLKVIEKFRVE